MADNEIIKALECCISDGYTCVECPYADTKHMIGDEYELMPNGKTYDEFSCDEWLKLDLFALINRQQAEIERLQGYNENLQTANTYLSNEILEAKAEAIKEVAERLKEEQEFFVNECDDFVGYVAVSRIDNLTKEMVGDSDA